jgi:single-strand DNA-binding protein
MLIGNSVKEPELKYTPSGTAVCNITVATNREWKDNTGQMKQEATFTRVVAWGKLGEIISQYLRKGGKVYIEGRISTRSWADQQNVTHYMTEVVAENMILLDSRPADARPQEEDMTPPEPEEFKGDLDNVDLGDSFDEFLKEHPAK